MPGESHSTNVKQDFKLFFQNKPQVLSLIIIIVEVVVAFMEILLIHVSVFIFLEKNEFDFHAVYHSAKHQLH